MLATMLGGRKTRRYAPALVDSSGAPKAHRPTSPEGAQALEVWDNIKGALIGVAATRFKDFVGEIVPGFHDEMKKAETRKSPCPLFGNVK